MNLSFDAWDNGFQLGVYKNTGRNSGFLINFLESGSIAFYKMTNGTLSQIWVK